MTKEPTYLVTGANKGIGLEICRQVSRMNPGAVVLLTARSEERGRDACGALQAEGFANVVFQQLDVTDAGSVEAARAVVVSRYGGLDVLVQNAGYATKGPLLDEQVARDTFAVNYFGVQRVGEVFLPLIRAGGRMVIVSSGMSSLVPEYSEDKRRRLGNPAIGIEELTEMMDAFIQAVIEDRVSGEGWRASAYGVSKAGVNALARIWARDSGARGIKVYACCPGWVRTDMGGPNASLDVAEGAATPVWLATAPPGEIGPSGEFYSNDSRRRATSG